MIPDGRLRDYPFVVVRFACRDCPRMGRYRLAILAERFGADADLATVLEAISASCPRQRESHPGRGCRAYYPDLPPTQPPDLPADLRPQRLRLIMGGRSDPSWVPVMHAPTSARQRPQRLLRVGLRADGKEEEAGDF